MTWAYDVTFCRHPAAASPRVSKLKCLTAAQDICPQGRITTAPRAGRKLQQGSLKFPARAVFGGWHRRPARIFNCAARSRSTSFSRGGRASRSFQTGSSRLVEAVRGGKVGRESRRSGKGSRPELSLLRGPLSQSPPGSRGCDISPWRLAACASGRCDAAAAGFLLSRIRQGTDVAAHLV